MGFLTDREISSLHIHDMILHVVGEGKKFTKEKARKVEHAPFFIERILDTDASPVHAFKTRSDTRDQLQKIASGSDFEAGAQSLSKEFSKEHSRASLAGAFFIFQLSVADPNTRIYSMIKYDYREAIEQTDRSHGNLLRRIIHAFIADRKAIQKSALVRVVGGKAEAAVAACDRARQGPDIGDYFAAFLGVERTRSDEQLNLDVVEVLRLTLEESKAVLPDQDVAGALREAKDVLRNRTQIDEAAIAEAVVAAAGNPKQPEIRSALLAATGRKTKVAKLSGIGFTPDQKLLGRPPLRQLRTAEGVTLLYPDHAAGGSVSRAPRAGGGEVITIRTKKVTEDRIVRESARGAA